MAKATRTLQPEAPSPAPEPVRSAERFVSFEEGLAGVLWSQLSQMGLDGRPTSLPRWQESAGIKSVYSRWLAESVRQLEERGYLAAPDAERRAEPAHRLSGTQAWKAWNESKAAWLAVDDLRPLVQLTEAALAALPAVLTGKTSPAEILFPSSSMDKVQGLYKNNALADHCNRTLCAQLLQYVEARVNVDPAARLRLLEIGAGTGGTSAAVFAGLQPYREHIREYCYTDVSKAFLLYAEEQYGPHAPYLTLHLFDVERAPEEQALEIGAYDVVIATNVLHATRNIRESLGNAKALLKGNGLLMLNEMVASNLAAHLTFGLLEGWWRFEDDALRVPGSPALTSESWRRVLEEEGFRGMSAPAETAYNSIQQVIVAESDGILRRQTSKSQAIPATSRGTFGADAPPGPRSGPARRGRDRRRDALPVLLQGQPGPGRVAAERGIAVIGLSGRYPQARTLSAYWDNLKSGRDCITEIPEDRWPVEGFYREGVEAALSEGKSYCKWGGFLEGFAEFDPAFFQIPPREALNMDPQERLFIQSSWEVLEDAGYTRESLATQHGSRVGVFAGITKTGFSLYGPDLWRHASAIYPHTSFGSTANRVSYILNLRGPSMPVDTLCSSSLTAIHQACESLLREECELAIAGGVNLYLHPSNYVALCNARMLSPDGRCKSFGAGGNGMVPGEGVGTVLLKPLAAAVADGDHIYGVIRGTSINHGGRTSGYTVPSPQAQADLIRTALGKASVSAETLGYLEAHGTGTELGDPIEISGLSKAFGASTHERQFCAIGSVKSSIGHCESAAGIAGVTKVLLQLKHGQLVPGLHAEQLNPHIDFAASPFVVQRELGEWKRRVICVDDQSTEYPRRAGISSFGALGANAHVVIEEYIAPDGRQSIEVTPLSPAVIVLSARDEERLGERVRQLLSFIESGGIEEKELANVAYTLQVGREAMEHRLALLVVSVEDLGQKLARYVAGEDGIEDLHRGEVRRNSDTLDLFTEDEDLQLAIAAWMEKKKYAKLLDLWVKGLSFDWNRLYGELKPCRVALPVYPFARQRYWITTEHIRPIDAERPREVIGQSSIVGVPASKPNGISLQSLGQSPGEGSVEPNSAATSPGLADRRLVPIGIARPEGRERAEEAGVSGEWSLAEVEATLTQTLAETLMAPQADMDVGKPFLEMGLDSILGVEWIRALNQQFELKLPASKIYDHPSVAALSRFVLAELAGHPREARSRQGCVVEAESNSTPDVAAFAAAIEEPADAVKAESVVTPRAPPAAAPTVTGIAVGESIAIVGMSGRYAGARDLEQFWQNLAEGRDSVVEVPASRWDVQRFYDPRPQPGKVYCKWLGALEDVECFDPLFFGISPAEAELMDPQQRLFLEEGYRAFEDAGYNPRGLENVKCGVYLGIMGNEYAGMLQFAGMGGDATGNSAAIAASRISYVLNLKGPALSIDTACSSSLVATHLACQALRTSEIDMALVGGVTTYLTPGSHVGLCAAGMLSPEGRCKTLDNSANGFVPGEGVGALVLKRLSDAEAAGDRIHGVIIASGINQDGKTNGIMAPNGTSQSELIRQVYARYRVEPETIGYAELHGTGTKLGDPVELGALSAVFEEKTSRKRFCGLGSVKSSIGHTSAAAGVASAHKVLLSLRHRQLAPTLHFKEPNEHFDFEDSPFYVSRELRQWDVPTGSRRRAAVSSFGHSGTNAHLVIEEYAGEDRKGFDPSLGGRLRGQALFVLSARTEERLRACAQQMLSWLRKSPGVELNSLTYTLQVGREEMEHRMAAVVGSVDEIEEKLAAYLLEKRANGLYVCDMKRGRETLAVLGGDDDVEKLVEAWIAKGKYGKLLDLWVRGRRFDWRRLYGEQRPQRLSLPAYPFARERYWITSKAAGSQSPSSTPPSPAAADPLSQASVTRTQRWLRKQWRSAPLSSSTPRAPSGAIIVASQETATLAQRVATLFPLSRVIRFDGDSDSRAAANIPFELFDTWIDVVGCGSIKDTSTGWLDSLQQWIERGRREGMTALGVTGHLETLENPKLNLAGALRAGLYRLLGSEYARLHSRHIDTDLAADAVDLVEQIRLECLCTEDEVEACYRRGRRFVACLRELEQGPQSGGSPGAAFPEGAVLWISGGTRGLGYRCAEHFIRRHNVTRVVLAGRTPLPERERWETERRKSADLARRMEAIEALEALGVQVRVSTVQLTDREALHQELEEVRRTLGPIGGVLHCAAHFDATAPAFVRKSLSGIDAVLAPKVGGLDNLVSCVRGDPLQFFVLFSSVSAVIPSLGVGHSDYAMANSYMDYVAEAYSGDLPIISIQWSNWKESGVGEVTSSAFRDAGLLSQTDAEGLAMLDEIIRTRPAAVVLPVVADPLAWQPERLMRASAARQAPSRAPRQVADEGTSPPALLDATCEWLKALVCKHLKIDEARVDVEAPLQDYGVDSVLLPHLAQPLTDFIGAPIPPSSFFEYPTIASHARWLVESHRERLTLAFAGRGSDVIAAEREAEPAPDPIHFLASASASAPVERSASEQGAACARDIAVVGLACRFPGAGNLEEFWDLLAQGRSAIGPVPASRGRVTENCYAALLENVTHFDPEFFRIDACDAAALDPQALIVLEESLSALCHAGYSLKEVKGARMGVYIGARSSHRPDAEALLQAKNPILAVGQNYLATNISRCFDLRGPSLVVDTACSSALVATSLAVQALRAGDIEAALVGGVTVLRPDEHLPLFEHRGLLQKDAQFHIFDRRAHGAILGEGAGMIVLKTAERARHDGDAVYAVIRGIAVNNDGQTLGPTAPNMQAQKDVMVEALEQSRLRREDIAYIEVNGAGTELRDLIEVRCIESVYRAERGTPCELGSMKPNIGHPLCAEGIASFIKSVLMLHKGAIVPFLSAEQPGPHYDFNASPFRFTRVLRPWQGPNRAMAINCFADGGTNAHVILEAASPGILTATRRAPMAPPALKRLDVCRHSRMNAPAEEIPGSRADVKGARTEGSPGGAAIRGFGFWNAAARMGSGG
jgi:acyl transferase domain-containing protein/acyl carrier protein